MQTTRHPQDAPPSFESVWAMMQENAVQMEKFRESQEKTARKIDILTDQMGGLHNKFGEMAEHLVAPGVVERFNNLGYHFDGIADRGFKILDEKRNLLSDNYKLSENSDYKSLSDKELKIPYLTKQNLGTIKRETAYLTLTKSR